jgi:2-octaprenyl-6-methoxyphenol hydroxylase
MNQTAWRLAIVGAGPAGLALALHAARLLPHASLTLFDARPLERDVSADPRTLALALGSVQFLQRLNAWPGAMAQAITQVHVSQAPPSFGQAQVLINAADLGVPQLGAVLAYGALVAPLQQAWLAAVAAEPQRLASRFGTPVAAIKALPGGGAEVDAGIAEAFDLAVVAEGGVFADQARKSISRDYGQTAWVGTVTLQGATPGMAFERFTRQGPAALLPLRPDAAGQLRAALVWCVNSADDPVRDLSDVQRLAVLNSIFPPEAGRLVAITPLQSFALGLNAERTLVGPGLVRIGNAAQTLHPVAGQGLNLGLRDAQALVAALRHATDLQAALRRVEWARAPDRWSMLLATDFLARSFTWQVPGLAGLRGVGLGLVQAFPPARAFVARRMMFGGR